MRTNVENKLARDQKNSELDDRTEALLQGATQFEQAEKLEKMVWWKNRKMTIIILVIGAVVVGVIGAVVVVVIGGKLSVNTKVPDVHMSSKSRMLVSNRTSSIQPSKDMGFTVYREAICGGDFIQEKGIFHSPNYPEHYGPNMKCTWRITVPENHQVSLEFLSFNIEIHDKCKYDYLEIRDGHKRTSPLLGRFCGHRIPEDIRSSGNKMTVKFVSNKSVQKAGFMAEFIKDLDECKGDHGCEHECTNTLGAYKCECRTGFELHSDGKRCGGACGGFIQETNGTIVSPSFPDLYPPNKTCIWHIFAPPQYRITLNFTHFDLEGNDKDCESDSVDIRGNIADTRNKVKEYGVFCGSRLPPLITSVGYSLRIEFSSDNSVQKSGFSAFFFTDKDECSTNNGGCQQICKNTMGSYACSCHNGFLLHENLHDCKEDKDECAANNGGCQHVCKNTMGSYACSCHNGFLLHENLHDCKEVCGDRLLAHRSMELLYSHAKYGDQSYDNEADCDWIVQGLNGQRVRLRFLSFEVELQQNCGYDYVEVYDGEDDSAKSLGKFCGNKVPPEFYSSGNSLMVRFRSDDTINAKGFSAAYAALDSSMEDNEDIV